jgi:hypothetical protein
LFTDQGVGHYAQGPMVGREAIRKLFFEQGRAGSVRRRRIYPHIVFSRWLRSIPAAAPRGRWHVLALLGGGNATWVGGVCGTATCSNGAWKIADLTRDAVHRAVRPRLDDAPRRAPSAPPATLR